MLHSIGVKVADHIGIVDVIPHGDHVLAGHTEMLGNPKKALGLIDRDVGNVDTGAVLQGIENMTVLLTKLGGDGGGRLIGAGTPEEISRIKNSETGKYLKPYLK